MKIVEGKKSFALDVIGYEFENAKEFYDANWLTIKIDASDENYTWSAIDHCLLTTELNELYEWVDSIDNNCRGNLSIDFMENELRFKYEGDSKIFTVICDFNFHPKGESFVYGEDGDSEYEINFHFDKSNKQGLVKSIKRFIDKFPVKQV